ncbi:hypothetical protein EV424DRAFT_1354101 [Suillus variegatus]|nr:hypothetical protein EV424DRAFT_1354101 [Suillus variegatus]
MSTSFNHASSALERIDTSTLITIVDDNHDTILFEPAFNTLVSSSSVPTINIEFVGYVLQYPNPEQPVIYPLYSPPLGLDTLKSQLAVVGYLENPIVHSLALELPGYEVPLFAAVAQAMETTIPFLNLWWVQGWTGLDTVLHGVYHYMDVAHTHEPEVKVHLAVYPFGNYVSVVPGIDTSVDGSTILQTTWISSLAMTFDTPHTTMGHQQPRSSKKVLAAHSLHQIMEMCQSWCRALAYLHMLLRIAICCGCCDNPHLLVNMEFATHRLKLIRSIWPECLLRANVTSEDLETVLTKVTQLPMSHSDVLALASPWVTQFMYDNRRVVVNSMDNPRIFGLCGFFGLAQRGIIVDLLRMFTCPHAHMLPIEVNFLQTLPSLSNAYFALQLNGFTAFLMHQIAKELIYHMIFRTMSMCPIRFTIADLEPATFRTVANPPVETLALAGSSCYQALWARLLSLCGANETMPDYPSAAQIHSELCETAVMLLQQENDPNIARLRAELRQLCVIIPIVGCLPDIIDSAIMMSPRFNLYTYAHNSTTAAVIFLMPGMNPTSKNPCSSSKLAGRSITPNPCHSWEREGCCYPASLMAIAIGHHFDGHQPSLYTTRLHAIYHLSDNTLPGSNISKPINETALLAWLQAEGRDMLPDSLLTTASMLSGWVNTHDIIALLDVSLREITMQTQLQQEEDMSYAGFHSQVAFSAQKPPVDNIAYVEASPELNPVSLNHFEPSQVIRDKCNAWLHVPSHFLDITQVDSNATGTLGSPKAAEISPGGSDTRQSNDQFLSLPRSLKIRVDNVTYRAYMNATFAEAKPLYIHDNGSFKAKEQKTHKVLKSDIYILGLKKQCTQSKVDMLSEAISRISEFATSSGSAVTHASLLPDDYIEDRFDNWVSTSYGSSDIEYL